MNVAASESTPGRIDGQKARVGRLYGLSAFDHVYRPPNRKGLCSHASMHNTNHNVSTSSNRKFLSHIGTIEIPQGPHTDVQTLLVAASRGVPRTGSACVEHN